jgi:hypothetical protein
MKKLLAVSGVCALVVFLAVYYPQKSDALNVNHNCTPDCHNLHAGGSDQLLKISVVEDLCLSCHGPGGTATRKAVIHTNDAGSPYDFSMSCRDCHDPHDNQLNWLGGTNLMMVGSDQDGTGLAKITTPNSGIREVAFTSRGTDEGQASLHSFADNDEDSNSYWDGVCETCHTLTYHQNDGNPIPVHHTGETCTVCHPHADGFLPTAGSCLDCHDSVKDNGDGPPIRRAVSAEFSQPGHHVGSAVTDNDCRVCHYEAVDSAYHKNNQIDLRDPDSGEVATLISFASFSRDTTTDVLESDVTNIQDNFCMKCHDAGGATATYNADDGANALQPFSTGSTVPDVLGPFSTGNSYHHAVRGAGSNPYCVPSATNGSNITMVAPWNQDATHDQITCFDCHGVPDGTGVLAVIGHGSSNQRMLRDPIDLDTMEAAATEGDLAAGTGAAVETFCTECHKTTVYVSSSDPESAGSIFEFHGAGQMQHGASMGNELGCMGCHGGIVDFSGLTGNGFARGNIHGGIYTWESDSWASGSSTEHFIVGGWNSGWAANTSTGNNGCGGGDCNHPGKMGKPGKEYTN